MKKSLILNWLGIIVVVGLVIGGTYTVFGGVHLRNMALANYAKKFIDVEIKLGEKGKYSGEFDIDVSCFHGQYLGILIEPGSADEKVLEQMVYEFDIREVGGDGKDVILDEPYRYLRKNEPNNNMMRYAERNDVYFLQTMKLYGKRYKYEFLLDNEIGELENLKGRLVIFNKECGLEEGIATLFFVIAGGLYLGALFLGGLLWSWRVKEE
ncbi:MAG: hypothetical protein JEZ07_12075 [Phycisphaerae bacterium]|nr:hypothetical protein [Phycisphaerae bacterium]